MQQLGTPGKQRGKESHTVSSDVRTYFEFVLFRKFSNPSNEEVSTVGLDGVRWNTVYNGSQSSLSELKALVAFRMKEHVWFGLVQVQQVVPHSLARLIHHHRMEQDNVSRDIAEWEGGTVREERVNILV